jgi:MerR family transcriptional regulator, Zn(II)-responsive regulator of zntA
VSTGGGWCVHDVGDADEQKGLIPAPERTEAGYRDCEPAVAKRLEFIRADQGVALTLRQLDVVRTTACGPAGHRGHRRR